MEGACAATNYESADMCADTHDAPRIFAVASAIKPVPVSSQTLTLDEVDWSKVALTAPTKYTKGDSTNSSLKGLGNQKAIRLGSLQFPLTVPFEVKKSNLNSIQMGVACPPDLKTQILSVESRIKDLWDTPALQSIFSDTESSFDPLVYVKIQGWDDLFNSTMGWGPRVERDGQDNVFVPPLKMYDTKFFEAEWTGPEEMDGSGAAVTPLSPPLRGAKFRAVGPNDIPPHGTVCIDTTVTVVHNPAKVNDAGETKPAYSRLSFRAVNVYILPSSADGRIAPPSSITLTRPSLGDSTLAVGEAPVFTFGGKRTRQ